MRARHHQADKRERYRVTYGRQPSRAST